MTVMAKWIIDNGVFVTADPARPLVRGYMSVENDLIVELQEGTYKKSVNNSEKVIDGGERVFMPGWVNTHCHAAMSLLRGYGDDLALQVWLTEKMWPLEARFTGEDVKSGTLLSILEMMKGGVTTFVDMYDHMDEVAEAVESSGIRGVLTRGVIGLCSEEEQRLKLEEAIRFARDWNGKADGRITTMLSPHSPYTCSPELISKFVEAAHDLNLPIHIHMSETRQEVDENISQYGLRPALHLEQLGVFSRPCLIAHGVHLSDEEIDILCRHDVRISHNPGSNLKLASGIARVPELLQAGLLVSLGTDSSASNNNLDMFEEARLAALIHKGATGDPTAVPAAAALRMGTSDGAKSVWISDTGMLKAGMKADFVALDTSRPHFYPRSDYTSHIIYSASAGDVTDVWINGKQTIRGGECLTLDEEKIKFEFQKRYEVITGI